MLGQLQFLNRLVGRHLRAHIQPRSSFKLQGLPFFLMPSACVALRNSYGIQQWRRYATKPPGGSGGAASGGFPGLSFGSQHQKGDALKEYVCLTISISIRL